MNLRGNKSLPGAVLAKDQDGAIAFGNPVYRALNARLGGTSGSRLPLSIVDHFSCCHMGTKLHIIVSMQALNPAVKYAEYASNACYGLGEGYASSGNAGEGGRIVPSYRKTVYH
ncbi:MAG: hypothetical protein WAK26_07430 [Terracidiphilus sp.]